MVKARESNTKMTMTSGSAIRKNLMGEIIKMITVITLKMVFKIG